MNTPKTPSRTRALLPYGLMLLVLLVSLSCNFNPGTSESLEETENALEKQQTKLAKEVNRDVYATMTAQQATIEVQSTQAAGVNLPPTPDLSATQVAQSVQQTLAAAQPPQNPPAQPTVQQPPTAAPTQPPPPIQPTAEPGTGASDFKTWMSSASILLYEDIINDPQFTRYVKRALDKMRLNYKDDGSAKGWFKNDLLGGGPKGKPWDLVIMAAESRSGIQGEYFDYMNGALGQGSSLIIEAWHLDAISQGTVSTLLSSCGVQVYQYFPKTQKLTDVIVWPLGNPHPVLSQPNSGMKYTKVLDTWIASGDLGSLMALTGQGDAVLLLGTTATERNRDGGLAVCMNGRFILQTFSTHSFSQDTMLLLWENYIYNALEARFQSRP